MNACAMIAACGRHQVGEAIIPDCGTPPDEPAYHGNPIGLGVTDHGIDGYAGYRSAYEDTRDDGTPVTADS